MPFDKCLRCDGRLCPVVRHCPYCGAAVPHADSAIAEPAPTSATATASPAASIQSHDVHPGEEPAEQKSVAQGAPTRASSTPQPPSPAASGPAARPKSNGPSARPKAAPPTAPVQPQHEEVAVEEGPQGPRSGGKGHLGKVGLALVVLAAAGYFLNGKSSAKPDPCQDGLSQAASLLANGNAAGARSQTVLAMASCSGEERSKATDLLAAADKALEKVASCERSFRQIGSLVADRRVQRAGGQLDSLDTACIESPQGKALRLKIDEAQATASDAATRVRKHLAEGDLKSAVEQLDRLSGSNREHSDLPGLRQEVQAAGAAVPATSEEPQAQKSTAVTQSAESSQNLPSTSSNAQPSAEEESEKVQALLHEGESALRQNRFDVAKAAVDSARRIDPVNPRAAALSRRIKERELQYRSEQSSK